MPSKAKKLAIAANRGEPEAKARLETLLDKNGLDKGSIVSDAIIRRLVEFERLERLISSAEKRRDDILKSIDPRRQNLAQCLTKNIDDIVEDVEVERKEISVSPLS